MDNKKYMDEQILKMRIEKENEQLDSIDISKGLIIDDIQYNMEQKIIINDYLYIMLPKDYFFEMPEELKRLKYPSEFRPPIIKTTLDTQINLTFNILNKKLNDNDLIDFTKKIRNLKRRTVNSFEAISIGVIQNETFKISYFDYLNSVLDGTIYILEFFVLLEECVLYGTFSCPLSEYEFWKKVIPKIIKTINIIEKIR